MNDEARMSNVETMRASADFWGAHAPSRAHFGALAEMLWIDRELGKVRNGEGAIASTRGACAPQAVVDLAVMSLPESDSPAALARDRC